MDKWVNKFGRLYLCVGSTPISGNGKDVCQYDPGFDLWRCWALAGCSCSKNDVIHIS